MTSPMRIVILGSAPGAQCPDGDAVYCANSAAAHHAEAVVRFPSRICVVSEAVVASRGDAGRAADDPNARRFADLLRAPVEEIVVLRHRAHYRGWDFEGGLRALEARFAGRVRIVDNAARRDLARRVARSADPVLNPELWEELRRMPLRRRAAMLVTLLRSVVGHRLDVTKEVHPALRPSTGLNALLLAIDAHGPEAEYRLCGISLEPRSDRSAFAHGAEAHPPGLTHHLLADRMLWRRLRRRYTLRP